MPPHRKAGPADFTLSYDDGTVYLRVLTDENDNLRYRTGLAEMLAPQYQTEEFSYRQTPSSISLPIPLEDFERGAGFVDEDALHETDRPAISTHRYSHSQHLDASWSHRIYISPKRNATMGGGEAAAVKYLDCTLGLFRIAGQYLDEFDASSESWATREDLGSGNAFTDIEFFDGLIMAGAGDTVAYRYSVDGVAFSTSTLAGNSKYAKFFAVRGQSSNSPVIWKVLGTGALSNATDPTNAGTWSAIVQVGDTGETVNSMIEADDSLYVFKIEGIYRYGVQFDATLGLEDVWVGGRKMRRQTNGVNAFLWGNGKIYVTYGDRLMEYTPGGDYRFVFPTDTMQGNTELNGTVRVVGGDSENIYVSITNAENRVYIGKLRPYEQRDPVLHSYIYLGEGSNSTLRDYIGALVPVGYWRLGEASGDAIDSSTSGNDGSVTIGAGTRNAAALNDLGDGSIDFDGADSSVVVTADAAFADIFDGGGSVVALFRADGIGEGSEGRLLNHRNPPGWELFISDLSGSTFKLNFYIDFSGTDGHWRTTTSPCTIGSDYALVVTYNADATTNDPTLYLLDIAANTRTVLTVGDGLTEVSTPVGTRSSDAAIDFRIGNSAASGTTTWDGLIDEIALLTDLLSYSTVSDIFSRVLSAPHTCNAGTVVGEGVIHPTNPVLMVGYGESAAYFINARSGLRPEDDTAYRYETSEGLLVGAWKSVGAMTYHKLLTGGATLSGNVNAGKPITLAYEIDEDGVETTLLNVASNGMSVGCMSAADVDTEVLFHRIREYIRMQTDDDTAAPHHRGSILNTVLLPPRKRVWSVDVTISDDVTLRGGGRLSQSYAAVESMLHAMLSRRVTLTDRNGRTFGVRLLDIQGGGVVARMSGDKEVLGISLAELSETTIPGEPFTLDVDELDSPRLLGDEE